MIIGGPALQGRPTSEAAHTENARPIREDRPGVSAFHERWRQNLPVVAAWAVTVAARTRSRVTASSRW
ncbi:hypothetical protein M2302_001751 [Micromonospora sp. A200]|nr:hypothetical protein [Micromonospora sp. A200]